MKVYVVIGAGNFGDMEAYGGVFATLEGALASVNGVLVEKVAEPVESEDEEEEEEEQPTEFELVDMSEYHEGSHEHDFWSNRTGYLSGYGIWIQKETLGA